MLVLRAVVEDYIRSQEPVGSAMLAQSHDLNVSSATIRNDMAALEEEGYLIQPHTSAGRVPTEKGYRYFVDRLSGVMPLSAAQRRGIEGFLSGSVSLADTLRRAARLLSQITGQVAVVAAPSLSKSTLKHIELVPVASATLLAVVITDTGSVAQRALAVRVMPSPEAAARFGAAVNEACAGLTLAAGAAKVRSLAASPALAGIDGLTGPTGLAEALARTLEAMGRDEDGGEMYMSGASHLAHQRTMADLAPLFDALEEQVVLMKLMSALSEEAGAEGGVGVAIGSETHTPGLMHASVVTSGYGPAQGGEVAFVGSIGPTHMDYAATMSAVRAVARYLTAFLSEPGAAARDGDGKDTAAD